MIKMKGDRSGIAELTVVQDGLAMFSKSFIKLAFGLSNVLASGIAFVALHYRFWATYRKVLDKNRLDDLAITYSALQSKPWNRDSFQPVSLSLYMSCPSKSSGIPEDMRII